MNNKAAWKRELQKCRKKRNQLYIWEYLKDKFCVDCEEENSVVLEFDHVSGKKNRNVCQLVVEGYSIKKIQAEISKCEIRCANCHRIKTAKTFYKNFKFAE